MPVCFLHKFERYYKTMKTELFNSAATFKSLYMCLQSRIVNESLRKVIANYNRNGQM